MKKAKKMLAAVMAGLMCLLGATGILAFVPITANAEDEVLTYGDLMYAVTGEGWIMITGCDESAVEVEIPTEIDGMPVTYISLDAFSGCTNLTSVIIPEGVVYIDDGAFSDCTILTSITIPASVTWIGWLVFDGCTDLTSIQVDSDNENYASEEGVLFNTSESEGPGVLRCPCQKEGIYTIPDGVTWISPLAFSECINLTSITIPEGVTLISGYAFEDCTNLRNITIPESMTKIVPGVFLGCENLTDVYYAGTEEQWNTIEIGEYGNEALTTATIHFNATSAPTPIYGDVDENGELNIMDVILLNRNLMVGADVSAQGLLNADVDGNGTADAVDSLNILKAVVKLIALPIA